MGVTIYEDKHQGIRGITAINMCESYNNVVKSFTPHTHIQGDIMVTKHINYTDLPLVREIRLSLMLQILMTIL